jgi:ribosomal protein S18 acetylase RimI-like enzyme
MLVKAMMSGSEIYYRKAEVQDSSDVVSYIRLSGDGLYEFLLDNVIPTFSCSEVLKWAVGVVDSPLSYKNCYVAVHQQSDHIIGMINVFPADRLSVGIPDLIKTSRWKHIEPIYQLRDAGSLFVNALAVCAEWRRKGVGARLMEVADSHALAAGFGRISLQVWSHNKAARAFYKRLGFSRIAEVSIPLHDNLPNKTNSILMRRKVLVASLSKV